MKLYLLVEIRHISDHRPVSLHYSVNQALEEIKKVQYDCPIRKEHIEPVTEFGFLDYYYEPTAVYFAIIKWFKNDKDLEKRNFAFRREFIILEIKVQ